MTDSVIRGEYPKVKRLCWADWKSVQAGDAIVELTLTSLQFLLDQCQSIDLISMVPGKHYFTFRRGDVFARPANRRLFLSDPLQIKSSWNEWLNNTLGIDDFVRLSYTVSLAPCLAMEIFDR